MDAPAAGCLRLTLVLLLLCCGQFLHAKDEPKDPRRTNTAAAAALFSNGVPLQIEIQISDADVKTLKKDSRKYVSATVIETLPAGNQLPPSSQIIYTNVGLHLKGSAGSFRQIDDPKPAFTLSLNQFNIEQRFHGLRKIHLNNSVQDASYLNELLAGELFRAANVPATRVAHAMVTLNGKRLQGLYVLKEGFTKDFLALFFKKTNGNLYDMDPGREITEKLKKDMGDGPNDWSDLKALVDATKEQDPSKRWEALGRVLDLDRFVAFMVMEVMTCHWDGYCLGRNNFRVYADRDSNKILFFPHGTDQMFQNPTSPIHPPNMQGMLAQVVMRTPQGRRMYREKFGMLFTNVFKAELLTSRVDTVTAQVAPLLATYDQSWANEFRNQAAGVKDRIVQRGAEIRKQLAMPQVAPLQFVSGVAKPPEWRTETQPNIAKLDRAKDDGRSVLHIVALTTNTVASWRSKLLLEGGRYRFEGMARSSGIVPLAGDKKGPGAGLRISQQSRTNSLISDKTWTRVAFEFEAASPDDEVDLVCELRAQKGEVWFDADSLQLVRIKE